jgi:hypothetical protein
MPSQSPSSNKLSAKTLFNLAMTRADFEIDFNTANDRRAHYLGNIDYSEYSYTQINGYARMDTPTSGQTFLLVTAQPFNGVNVINATYTLTPIVNGQADVISQVNLRRTARIGTATYIDTRTAVNTIQAGDLITDFPELNLANRPIAGNITEPNVLLSTAHTWLYYYGTLSTFGFDFDYRFNMIGFN